MATMNISLPDQMKSWVEENVQTGRYANASDYMRDLIRQDRNKDLAIEQVQQMITEGVSSGMGDKSVDDIWNDVRSRYSHG